MTSRRSEEGEEGQGEDDARMEELEQALIRSVKTSGLKKPRELALVDQLLELRKMRRRAASRSEEQTARLSRQNAALAEDLEKVSATLEQQHRDFEARLQEEVRRLEESYKNKLDESTARRDVSVKRFVSAMKEKYNSQVSILEAKLSEIKAAYDSKTRSCELESQRAQIDELTAVVQEQKGHIQRLVTLPYVISANKASVHVSAHESGTRRRF